MNNENIIIEDGFSINTETGEVTALELPTLEFKIDSDDALNWVLEKIMTAEAEVAAVEQTAAVIAARSVIANAEAIKKAKQKRVDWLHTRFAAEAAEYARTKFKGKERSLKTVYGTVGVRATPAKLAVKSEEAAILWATWKCPEAVKTTKKFLISSVPSEIVTELLKQSGGDAFEVIPAHDKPYITTGAAK